MKKRTAFVISILLAVALNVMPAAAYTTSWGPITVHITGIQTPGAPLNFDFTTDNTPSSCNGFVFYQAVGSDEATQIANGNAVLASLLAAELSGHSVNLWGNNPTSGSGYCSVLYLWVNNQ